MAQAGPITDVIQRLFSELRSKNEETRTRAAFELYDNVLSASRGAYNWEFTLFFFFFFFFE